jgi:AcrR family transcriptional regulator
MMMKQNIELAPRETPMVAAPMVGHVDLLETNKPRQERAVRTYEAILAAAADLLVEVGVERISTNLIAERAGVTVPALYRYFPNKYSILNALGARLMDRQNEVFAHWHEQYADDQSPQALLDRLYELLRATYDVTAGTSGGLQIIYSMQLAPLQQVRLESHWTMAKLLAKLWCEGFGIPCTQQIENSSRMAVEIGYMAVQLGLEDPRIGAETALRQGAQALRLYLDHVVTQAESQTH